MQQEYCDEIMEKGQSIIDMKKLGDEGKRELGQIIQSKHVNKMAKKAVSLRDQYMQTAKYNYETPPMIFWNEVELKIGLGHLSAKFNVQGDMEVENGHTFSYSVMVFFPQQFQHQVIQNQFAPYDAIPSLIDPANLAKKNIKKVLRRNQKKYGRTQGANTLLEVLEIQKHSKEMGIEFLNSVDKALFGEFNNAQMPDMPSVRVKKSDWIELICFKPQLNNDQMYQASVLSGDKNWIDECLANVLEILNVQDVQNVNLIMESIAQIHYDKVKYGSVKTDFLNFDPNDVDTFFTEDQKQFLSLFKACFKSKAEFDSTKSAVELPSTSMHEIPQHLLFANYLLQCLNAREQKTKLLYTLNTFRAIQRRLTIELREMGTRDKVLGDAYIVKPMEQKAENKIKEDSDTGTDGDTTVGGSEEDPGAAGENIDLQKDALLDINKYRFNKKMTNFLHSTCPLVPKYHATFGQPIERQEISQDIDNAKNTDKIKFESRKFFGRVDSIYKNDKADLNLVKDDYGIHILYDAAFADMRAMELEILKICSFYINKAEPLLDNDLRNMYPAVDRLKIIDEALHFENLFQEKKLDLVNAYLECYEHVSDILEQQRLIQAIVDEMAMRPKLNLSGTHFRDSYIAEIEAIEVKTQLIREVMKMLMANEFKENNGVREYIEKAYRLLYEQTQGLWKYQEVEGLEEELNKKEVQITGAGGQRKDKNDKLLESEYNGKVKHDATEKQLRFNKAAEDAGKIPSRNYSDIKEFATAVGIPFADLEKILRDHHERDQLVRVSLHEQVGFIKNSEGYPQFLIKNAQVQNKFQFNPKSQKISVLDFYESLTIMPRVFAAIQGSIRDLNDCHKPDNGLLLTSLEKATYENLILQLKKVQDEDNLCSERTKGIEKLDDNSVVGNPDKMLFFAKELAASANDKQSSQNPFVIGKLDVDSVKAFNFQPFQGYIAASDSFAGGGNSEVDTDKVTKANYGRFHKKLRERTDELTFPSMLILACNTVEVVRLRHTLLMTLEQTALLEEAYKHQTKLMGKEGIIYFKEQFNYVNHVPNAGENFVNFIDEGPADDLEIKLAINEYDRKLRSCVNFSDPECFKAMILPLGLEELRAVVLYEVMNLQALIVGVRTNQIQLDNAERKLSEINFIESGFTIPNQVFDLYSKLVGPNSLESGLKKLLTSEKSACNSEIKSQVGDGYYSVIARKQKKKSECERIYKAVKQTTISALKDQKVEVTQKQLRTLKIVLCHDYCQDILARVYCDAMKLQVLQETNNLRRRIYLLPRESIFLEMFPPRQGEHQFAAYNEDHKERVPADQQLFYSKSEGRIQNFWRLPSNNEICNIEVDIEHFKQLNMPMNFNYDLGVPAEKTLPEFITNNLLQKIQAKVPKISFDELRDVEAILKDRYRLVEFHQAYDYSSCGKVQQYLSYFKSMQNIFDLEFFTNKLASSANTIANVEKMVLSGIPFWEEGDDSFFGDSEDDNGSEDEGNSKEKKLEYINESKFEDGGHRPLKNVLASKVAEKVAIEKRTKMLLLQDLESVKDRFMEYEVIMKKQEMASNLQRAATFLNDIHNITFYGVLFILYQLQDNYFKDHKGQKEIQFINEVIMGLSHQQDLKVTYLNGFHVNYSVTNLQRANLERNCIMPDYDCFFKATQPVIDEEALNPPEFNLVQGIYQSNSINMITFKKNIPFMGSIIGRDYSCLDFSLTNVSKDTRKYIMSNLNSNDLTLQSYITAKMNINEREYQSNPSVYTQILQEKKNYLKTQIKARQSRRIMMIIRNKKMIPLEIAEFNEMMRDYHSAFHWKINNQMDQIAATRALLAERAAANSRGKSQQSSVNQSKHNKEAVLKLYDSAASEIEVVQNEIQKYLIKTAFDMFQSETNSLAKTFEMNNLKLQAFVHPGQQFASTFHQMVDNRNHLDIINKVGPIQKMLTQIKNRCLEIQTLTSGVGVVISSKDLNECLEECCRSLIKYGEIEMRTRCEHLALSNVQYENLLYIKDRQLLNLENKLRSAKQEMNKIVNTKVFSRGNNLIYELDMTNRQLRLLKDNIFLLEKNLTEKIRLCYDRELDQTRIQLADFRRTFKDYRESVNQGIEANVREKVNSIDAIMKQKAIVYKDLDQKTVKQIKLEEFKQKQINVNNTTINIDNVVIMKDGTVAQTGGSSDPKLLEELELLKLKEKEARDEVLKLQDIIRKNRILTKFKEVLIAERHAFKIDNLKQQLTSNTTLWEQLAEGEKREKILKQEIERAQQEIATQEKIIERLKDDIKQEGREKQKLLQYKNTKSKRLDELETKAREFEVLSSVNLGKILSLLESKERKITTMSQADQNMNDYINAMTQLNQQEMAKVRAKARDETKYKIEAMTKLEGLRQELQMIQGNDQVSVGFWKEQCQSLFDICKNLKEDNEKLVENLGNLSENAIMGMSGGINQSHAENAHPLDQFSNNQDLLNYLNQTPTQNQAMHNTGQFLNNYQREDYEKQIFGMNKSLQDHMMGINHRRGGSQIPINQNAGSSINSFASESKDKMPMNKFSLPKIGTQRNSQYNQQRHMIAQQQSPFMGSDLGPRRAPQGFGNNVFASLPGHNHSVQYPQNPIDGAGYKISDPNSISALDQTTMMQSSLGPQHSPRTTDQPSAEGGNIFNFAPQTQRGVTQDSLDQYGEPHALNTISGTDRKNKKQQQEIKLSLQPKLINPPSKLQKTLDHQAAKGGNIKRK